MANLSFSSMKLEVDGEVPDTAWLKKVFSKTKTTEPHGSTTHEIKRDIIDTRFYWFYSNYGKEMPRPDSILDISSDTSINNPRKPQQVELTNQLFAIYDNKSELFYISQLSKKKFLEEFLSQISKNNVIIKNVYKDIDEFSGIIKELGTVEFTKTGTGSMVENDLFKVDPGLLAKDEDAKLKVKLQYKNPITEGIKKRIRMINSHKNKGNIENLILTGEDDKGFETVFNADSFTSKISISVNKDKQHLFPPEKVKIQATTELKGLSDV